MIAIVLHLPDCLIIIQVIPALAGDATEQTPPDLPSYLFKERIVYLGMSFVPAVTELMLAELLYLQYENPNRPIYMYINSTGVAVSEGKRRIALGARKHLV
jgi:ATP-dependent Clp protease protease subunit